MRILQLQLDTLRFMIKSFRHKGMERFFLTGTKAGIQQAHAGKLARQLNSPDEA